MNKRERRRAVEMKDPRAEIIDQSLNYYHEWWRLLTAMLHHYQLVDGSVIPLSACKSGYSCRGAIIQLQTIAPVSVIYYLDYCRFAYPATSIRYRERY